MKLASRRAGRDGALLVLSRDAKTAVDAGAVAPTLQAALDDWDRVSPSLRELYGALNEGRADGAVELDMDALAAPLPRAYQFLDGACYLSHIRRNRAARGDALPDDVRDAPLVSGTMVCRVRGEAFGRTETGIDTPFHYGHLIAHAARTRRLEPGTLVGLGTVSNEDEGAGFGCVAERRAVETARDGAPTTELLRFGDRVRIELLDGEGRSVFGCIDQKVAPASL